MLFLASSNYIASLVSKRNLIVAETNLTFELDSFPALIFFLGCEMVGGLC